MAAFVVDGYLKRVKMVRWLALAAVLAVAVTALSFVRFQRVEVSTLIMSSGSAHSQRSELAELLVGEADPRQMKIELIESSGSQQCLDWLVEKKIDIALIQGGLEADESVRQIAILQEEPLHLLVHNSFEYKGLTSLLGQRINFSTSGSGTRQLSKDLFSFADIDPSQYVDLSYSYDELLTIADEELPEAVFVVSALPSRLIERLIEIRDYQLVPLPYAASMRLSDRSIQPFQIPAYTYSIEPAIPDRDLPTIATQLIAVVHQDLAEHNVKRLMELIYESRFALRAQLPHLDASQLRSDNEYPLHPGAQTYLRRGEPLVDGGFIESLESLRSMLFSGAIAAFLIWRWLSRRNEIGFEKYFDLVTEIETQAHQSVLNPAEAKQRFERFSTQLSQIKSEVLERHASGRLKGEEQLHAFLTHVHDVRAVLLARQSPDANASWQRAVVT